jgi:hypothetical protein
MSLSGRPTTSDRRPQAHTIPRRLRRIPSAEIAFNMHLREPKYREYEAPNAEPEHDDNHLAKPKIPRSVGKVRGNGCHQVNVSNNR